MNYGNIKYFDIADGPGVRVSLFVSGCRNHCKNCFNPETWDFNFGEKFTEETEKKIIEGLKPHYIDGFTLLGGDPFEPENQVELAPFLERLRAAYPQKSFWCYTGYSFDRDLLAGKIGDEDTVMRMLSCIDVLVDGKFVESLKDLNAKFRGSANQKIIDVKKSLERDELVEIPDDEI